MEILPNANTEWDKMTSASPTLMSERAFSPELFDEQEETAPDAAREEKEYTSDMDLLEDDHAPPNREASIDFAQRQSTSPPPHRSLSPSLQSPPPRKGSLQSPAWPLLSGAGTTLRTPPPQLPAGASRYAASPAFMEEEYDPDLMEDAGDFTPNPNGGMIGHHDDIEIPQEREDPSSCRLRKLEEQCRDQMEQMERLSTSLTEPLTRFKAEVEATTSEQQTRITTLEAECAALKAHQDSLERSLADLTERLARVEEQRARPREEVHFGASPRGPSQRSRPSQLSPPRDEDRARTRSSSPLEVIEIDSPLQLPPSPNTLMRAMALPPTRLTGSRRVETSSQTRKEQPFDEEEEEEEEEEDVVEQSSGRKPSSATRGRKAPAPKRNTRAAAAKGKAPAAKKGAKGKGKQTRGKKQVEEEEEDEEHLSEEENSDASPRVQSTARGSRPTLATPYLARSKAGKKGSHPLISRFESRAPSPDPSPLPAMPSDVSRSATPSGAQPASKKRPPLPPSMGTMDIEEDLFNVHKRRAEGKGSKKTTDTVNDVDDHVGYLRTLQGFASSSSSSNGAKKKGKQFNFT